MLLNTQRDFSLGRSASADPASAGRSVEAAERGRALQDDAAARMYRAAPPALLAVVVLGLAAFYMPEASPAGEIGRTWPLLLLLVAGARLLHALLARHTFAPPESARWTRRYTTALWIGTLVWASLPWTCFERLDATQQAAVLLATVLTASVEMLTLRALPRTAIAQAALVLMSGATWLFGGSEPRFELGTLVVMALAALVAGAVSLHRSLCATLSAEHELHRLALVEAEQRQRLERLELELTRSSAAFAEAVAQTENAKSGLEHSIGQRTAALERRSTDLARQAVTDSLTGLPNRKGINEHLIELLAPMADFDHRGELALLFLDLDEFKEVNDQNGHLAGDQVLRVVADRLRESLPRTGFAARWGGDEFIVVLPGMGKVDQVRMQAEKIRAELCTPIRMEEGLLRVGCSIGIALAPYHGRTPEALVLAADQAVYAAKTEGTDRVRVFDLAMAKKAQRQHQIAQALPAAVEGQQFEVAYQPIVSALDGTPSHVEALARWRHPKWGAVSPGEFIPVAESSGQIHAMGRWMLRRACLDAARWQGAHPPKVSVNVSAMQVNSGHLVAQVREALAAARLPARRLVIELTESLPMARNEGVSQTLSALREMGVSLAIDDFGTGYSSLSSLMKQPLSLVKIDQSFVRDVPGEGEILIKATVDVAHRFGLEVVAEGVETATQQSRLVALGVSYMQGYLFGRPMPNHEFMAWLALRDGSEEPFALRA